MGIQETELLDDFGFSEAGMFDTDAVTYVCAEDIARSSFINITSLTRFHNNVLQGPHYFFQVVDSIAESFYLCLYISSGLGEWS